MQNSITRVLLGAGVAIASAVAAPPTYYKDVLPVLQSRCQECHRPGEIGPMPLETYEQARPWAKAIKAAVASRKMPPWFADPHYGQFSNDRSMSTTEIDTLVAWADGGAPQGNAQDAPPERKWVEGWGIPKPDMVIEMPTEIVVPAKGEIDYQYVLIPLNFHEDRWIQMVEVRPTDRSVVHHAVVFVRDPESKWLRGEIQPGKPWTAPPRRRAQETFGGGTEVLTIYTPGMIPDIWRPGLAKKIPAGSDLILQMHYTANGKAAVRDRSRIGIVFSKEPPTQRVLTMGAVNTMFQIPPGKANFEVEAEVPHMNEAELLSFFPHMHLRGKAFEYKLVQPTGETQTLLRVPRYDFNWQLSYRVEKPIKLLPGSKMIGTALYDNSPNNPANPDPKATVVWGEQSWEEMMIGFYDVAIDAKYDRRMFIQQKKRSSD